MCIDLSISGIGIENSGPQARVSTLFSIPNGEPLNIGSDLPPVYILFGSDGAVTRVYTGFDEDPEIQPLVKNGNWNILQFIPSSDIYLAIGKTEQVQSFSADARWDDGSASAIRSQLATRDRDFKWNLSDSALQWVKISRGNGQVSNGPALEPKITAANAATKTFADMLFDSRQGLAIGFESSAK